MKFVLLPFSGIFWLITSFRNLLYDSKILPSSKCGIQNIVVGNLSTGGTGKSPMVMYLTNLLKDKKKIAILSRGYKRTTKGFQVVSYDSMQYEVGDEPMQFFKRFKNKVVVAVCENRVYGAKKLIEIFKPELLILDDAFQHRKFKGDFYILLTVYNQLYCDDYLLPAGNLRESRIFVKRAELIVVSKCPNDISEQKKQEIIHKLKPKYNQKIYFSSIQYQDKILSLDFSIDASQFKELDVLLVTGIAKGGDVKENCLTAFKSVTHLKYEDHFDYQPNDVKTIYKKFEELVSDKKIILTTEKDFTRLSYYSSLADELFYLPIEIKLDKQEEFNQQINKYVRIS